MADTKPKADTKHMADDPELTVEERLDRVEAAVGLRPTDTPEQTPPADPPVRLYAPPSEEELAAEQKAQEAATKQAEAAA